MRSRARAHTKAAQLPALLEQNQKRVCAGGGGGGVHCLPGEGLVKAIDEVGVLLLQIANGI